MGVPRIHEAPVLALAKHGCTSFEVAHRLRISTNAACRLLQRYSAEGLLIACARERTGGRPAAVWIAAWR